MSNLYVTQPPLPFKKNIDVPAFIKKVERYKIPQRYFFSREAIIALMKWGIYEYNDRLAYYSTMDSRAAMHAADYMRKAGVSSIIAEILARCEFVEDLLDSCMDIELWNSIDKKIRLVLIETNKIRKFLKPRVQQ